MQGPHTNQETVNPAEPRRQRKERGPAPSKDLRGLSPYKPVSSLDKIWSNPTDRHLKLDWNESTIPPSPLVYRSILNFLGNSNHLNWYPELGSTSLIDDLSDYLNVDSEHILVTNGSDDALDLICKAYLDQDDRVMVPQPTYTHFLVYVHSRGGRVEDFYSSDLFSADMEGLARNLRDKPSKIAYLVSPNNPTGVTWDKPEVSRLLKSFPETLFIVDEAYHE